MTVMKFGGAALRDADGFRRMVEILSDTDHAVVVVSALSTTTRDLETCALTAKNTDVKGALGLLESVLSRHRNLAQEALDGSEERTAVLEILGRSARDLERLLHGIAVTRQLTPRTLDRVLSFGEHLALTIAVHALSARGLDAVALNAGELIVTTDAFGSATPIESKSRVLAERVLSPLLDQHRFVVVQGFVGATERGEPTTMGKESSNLTATFVASLIAAERVVIWTDVDGIRSIDPKIESETELRPFLTYEQAKHAAHHGLKLLYKTMIEPAERSGIPITIAATHSSGGETTVISSAQTDVRPIVTLVETDVPGMWAVHVLFTNTLQWLSALHSAVAGINDSLRLHVLADPAASVVTITLSEEDAYSLARQLHATLTSTSKRSA